jgi:hypothetical protein
MEKRYTALRTIAVIMKVLGVLTAILTVFAVLSICGAGTMLGAEFDRFSRGTGGLGALTGLVGGLFATILPILMGGGLALFLFAAGDVLYLQIDIEENTRATSRLLQQRERAYAPAQQFAAPAPAPAAYPPAYPPAFPQTAPVAAVFPPPAEPAGMPALEDPGPMVFAFCPQCGTKLAPEAESCPSCGYQLSELQG